MMERGKVDRKGGWVVAALAALLAAAMVGCAMLGVVRFEWEEMWSSPIFWNLRAPRIVLSVFVGAGLSVCGAAYQSVFRNPLTDPYVLGVSSGASVGAAVAILLGLEAYMLGVGASALVTGLLTVVAIYRIASIGNRMHTTTLLLTGVCITFLMSAVISFLMVLRQDKMDSIIFWTMGSFASASWLDVAVVAPVVVAGVCVVLFYCRDLNLLLAGSETGSVRGAVLLPRLESAAGRERDSKEPWRRGGAGEKGAAAVDHIDGGILCGHMRRDRFCGVGGAALCAVGDGA